MHSKGQPASGHLPAGCRVPNRVGPGPEPGPGTRIAHHLAHAKMQNVTSQRRPHSLREKPRPLWASPQAMAAPQGCPPQDAVVGTGGDVTLSREICMINTGLFLCQLHTVAASVFRDVTLRQVLEYFVRFLFEKNPQKTSEWAAVFNVNVRFLIATFLPSVCTTLSGILCNKSKGRPCLTKPVPLFSWEAECVSSEPSHRVADLQGGPPHPIPMMTKSTCGAEDETLWP